MSTLAPSTSGTPDAPSPPPPADEADLRALCARRRDELRRRLDTLADRLDVGRAWRTVPLGDSARDPRRTPGVDIGTWILHVRYQRTRDEAVLAALVEEYTPYATAIARRLHRGGEPNEDIHQVAMEALVTSLSRFDVARRRPFPAYATPTITGAVKRHYRDRGWSIRTSRVVHDTAGPLREAEDRLGRTLGRPPTPSELAAEMGIDEATVTETQLATRARAVTSLDRPAVEGGQPLAESIGAADDDLLRAENRVALVDALSDLDERDRTVLTLYYFEEMSQRQIAERYGVSQMQVSRWLSSILARLRQRLVAA
ncbi:MAG TPA: sigma-70 family RNA polymerase sigma factor [Acidimicrobiales bacterium]|nr:sigma-70 family RNA polymerase sigma factor [Acidimicrobiales bacterium]